NLYSFKLGHNMSCSMNWYTNNKLFPIMLHIMLNIRSFLHYFLNNQRLEKNDIYLSHVNIGLNSGKLFISLYFYETKIEYKNMTYLLEGYEGGTSLRQYSPFLT